MSEVVIVELTDADGAVAAVRRLRSLGYTRLEAFTPFPIPELDDAVVGRAGAGEEPERQVGTGRLHRRDL